MADAALRGHIALAMTAAFVPRAVQLLMAERSREAGITNAVLSGEVANAVAAASVEGAEHPNIALFSDVAMTALTLLTCHIASPMPAARALRTEALFATIGAVITGHTLAPVFNRLAYSMARTFIPWAKRPVGAMLALPAHFADASLLLLAAAAVAEAGLFTVGQVTSSPLPSESTLTAEVLLTALPVAAAVKRTFEDVARRTVKVPRADTSLASDRSVDALSLPLLLIASLRAELLGTIRAGIAVQTRALSGPMVALAV